MNLKRLLNIVLILLGCTVSFYAQAEEKQNPYLLISGIVALMIGLYGISAGIPSKKDVEDDANQSEHERDEVR